MYTRYLIFAQTQSWCDRLRHGSFNHVGAVEYVSIISYEDGYLKLRLRGGFMKCIVGGFLLRQKLLEIFGERRVHLMKGSHFLELGQSELPSSRTRP